MKTLTHLDDLEAESIYIIREVAAECEKPVMLYSIGKDSSVMLHLALKAFYPEKPPFPFLHVDTTWKFKEMIQFRDRIAKKLGIELLVYSNEEGIKQGINPFDHGSAYTDIMKTQALKQALNKYQFTAAFGGGRRDEEKFVFQEGSVFTNLLLADEINRTSPKTQSALLEVMEERKVSVEGTTRKVPDPFIVIATQNPSGASGTQMLPEAQIDRFMITLSLGYPDFESELEIARSVGAGSRVDTVKPVLDAATFSIMQADIHNVFIKDEVYSYILKLVAATRNHPHIERGASPRATIALVRCAKAYAWLSGRQFVIPSDVMTQLPYVLSHRIILSATARMGNIRKTDIISSIAQTVEMPYMGAKK